jgi:cobalt-zinc-cadmium efflux system membrane fusion protein
MLRIAITLVALLAGIAIATAFPELPQRLRAAVGSEARHGGGTEAKQKQEGPGAEDKAGVVKLSAEQIASSGIDVARAGPGVLTRRIVTAGTIIPHADRTARVSVKLSATVAELRKKIGDPVTAGEVLAVLESREVADAKSEYLAARLNDELQQDLFARDKALWEARTASEQQFIRSRNQAAQTRMRLDIARQKLVALGIEEKEITGLPRQTAEMLHRQEVRSPMTGRVVERKVDLGSAVGRDNLETELFVIVNLDRVWVELAVSPGDLPTVKEGQTVTVTARGLAEKEGKVMFISPLLDKETRSARVVAELDNAEGTWRPGSFVSAAITVDRETVPLAAPAAAIQNLDNQKIVFVRTEEGFEKRAVRLGRTDNRWTELLTGVESGEPIAVANTFLLKSELLKAQTED